MEMTENNFNILLDKFSKFLKESEEHLPYNFNVLDEQCGHIVENSHTNILMKILQYRNRQRYPFFEDFINFIEFFDLDVKTDSRIVFKREAYYQGINRNGRIDGLIYQKNQFALIVENKVNGAGNQEEQLKTYIEGVLSDNDIFGESLSVPERKDRVWIIFLTREGAEVPDAVSLEEMQKCCICDRQDPETGEIKGPRYASVNYLDHILPWLKENVQPCVMQKEQGLNTGLLQYIDFLEGMFGMRQSESAMMQKCREWLSHELKTGELKLSSDFTKANAGMGALRNFVIDRQKHLRTDKNNPQESMLRCTNILLNLVDELNLKPLKEFFDVTNRYFTSAANPILMKECYLHAVFNYKYIQIRDASWPRSIHFEWYPLGVNKLSSGLKYTLCFHVECAKALRDAFDEDNRLTELLRKSGFQKSGIDIKSRRNFTFVKEVKSTQPMMKMKKDDLEKFLSDAYSSITKEIVDQINDILGSKA